MNVLTVSKYNNRRINTPDGWFDSKRELARWQELKLLERAGKITDLKRQHKFVLCPRDSGFREMSYMADFIYRENGREVVEDAKGYRNRVYLLKRRLMWHFFRINIIEV